jgi:hypothetical protein
MSFYESIGKINALFHYCLAVKASLLLIRIGEVRLLVRTDVRVLKWTAGCPSPWGGKLSGSGVVALCRSGVTQGG